MGLIEMNLALLILLIIGISLFINYLILLRTFFFKKTMVLLALEFLVSLIFAPFLSIFTLLFVPLLKVIITGSSVGYGNEGWDLVFVISFVLGQLFMTLFNLSYSNR